MTREDLLFGNLFDSCPKSWDVVPFEEAIDFQEGPGIMAIDFHEEGIPLIRLKGVQRSTVSLDGCNFLDPEKVNKKWDHFRLKLGDLLISTSATIGMVSEIGIETEGAIAYTGLIRLRPRNKKVLPGFIKQFASSTYFIQQAEGMAGGSVLRHFGPSHLRQMSFPIPPLLEQKAIASILGTLEEKIEINRRINTTLEAMSRALFQSWFVDFDPVRAKLDGSKPAGIDEPTANLFPDTFQDSELGNIPKGWTIKPVGEVVDCVGGGTPSTAELKYWEGGTHHWTTPKDFSSLQSPILLNTDRKLTDAGIAKISSGLLPAGTLLLSSRAPVGYLAIASMPVAINQGFIALKCNEYASNYFMLNWCQSNMPEIESRATGTTFAEISKQNFRPIRVVLPSKNLMSAFTAKVEPLYEQITANLRQSQTLASLRDTLLPKLLSGELSVENLQP